MLPALGWAPPDAGAFIPATLGLLSCGAGSEGLVGKRCDVIESGPKRCTTIPDGRGGGFGRARAGWVARPARTMAENALNFMGSKDFSQHCVDVLSSQPGIFGWLPIESKSYLTL